VPRTGTRNGFPSPEATAAVVDTPAPREDRTQTGQFAVTNVAELLERSAYYGFTSILGLYLVELGYSGVVVGAVTVILLALPYVFPLLTSPIAEKLGYKPVMLAALACYAAGFAVLASSDAIGAIVGGTALVAAGAGGFKPIATATIAHVTALRHRSLGFTIYYTGINIGGFAGPFIVAKLTDSLAAGFVVAGAIMVATLLLTLAFYRSPQPPQDVSVGRALAKLGAIFEDMRLVVLLLVFSGFWFLYSMNFSFLVLYLDRFVELPSWFEPSLQQSYNPLLVMVLAIPIGALATKKDPRVLMTVGVLLYVVGFSIVGFIQHVNAFFVGLLVATVGEILAYPAFLTYIAGIAPKDRIAVYQSYGFLPLFIGFLLGPLLSGPAYEALAVQGGRPELFWAIPISVGVLALAGFLATAQPRAGTTRRAGLARAAVVLLLVPVLFGAAALAGPQAQADEGPLTTQALFAQGGMTDEGDTTLLPVLVPGGARNITFVLTWRDEAAQGAGATNQPDQFIVDVADYGNGSVAETSGENPVNGEGRLTLVVPEGLAVATTWYVRITLLQAGDQVATLPLVGSATLAADTGNAWDLVVAADAPAPPESS
jgi:POT family proton-dependent oligopeptide transporter